ncbi:bifunctional metallophosphatase/5'-nucleotidase [Paenibacillus sp. SYP-B4298]|uniref:bifunctional metallophosphatase/5'-nucleotidase n=1 Tax=Paenibacillus sp. SYP-B4298 TaxID=2996034 RepID=UPI0022DE05FC|nr:bifunctional UDP-sugar hydrolase/5'-nucleotidase [Paenibacillus sp. SYP-B4298]
MNANIEKMPRVVLLHSNDLHSRLEQAARMASFISAERAACGAEELLVVDCGDHMDRMRVETEGSDGRVNIELLNAAGYDAVTLGNNEGLTYTKAELESAYASYAGFEVLCANLYEQDSGLRPEWLHPHTKLTRNGIRIGITAVTAAFAEFYRLLGWEATHPYEEVRRQVEQLRGEVDVLIVLSHLGLSADERMAEDIDGIDLILGAHTHHLLLEPIVRGSTTICAAGKFGEYMGRVEIELAPDSRKPIIRGGCIEMAAEAPQESCIEIIAHYLKESSGRLARQVAELSEPLSNPHEQDAPLSNLLAAGLKKLTGAELGLVNTGQLLGGLAVGKVTAGQLHALCPSPINPCKMKLSGADLLQALEESMLGEYRSKPIKGFGFRGEVLGALAVDGMELSYDVSRPPYHRIVSARIHGEPLQQERLYTVGTIDMFTFGVGYMSLKNGQELEFILPEFIRDVLASQLQVAHEREQCLNRRWRPSVS